MPPSEILPLTSAALIAEAEHAIVVLLALIARLREVNDRCDATTKETSSNSPVKPSKF